MPSNPHSPRRIPVEQLGRGVARHAVDVAVGRHDARDPGRPDRRLEREQLLVAQLARADVRRRLVEAALGQPMADHVLGRGDDAVGAGPDPGAPRCRRSRARRQGTDPRRRSPRSGPSADRGAMSRTGASACRAPVSSIRRRMVAAIADDDVRVEARRGADRLLEARRGPGDEAVQALLVDDRRDPEPRPLDEVALDRVRGLGHLDRPQVGRAREPGDLADAVRGEGCQRAPRRSPDSGTTSNAQNEPSWATFSARVIRAEQVGDARLDREGRVAVAGLDGRHQPFTDPAVRPPTMWRSAMT